MCIFNTQKRQEKKRQLNIECEELFNRVNIAIDEANDFFVDDEYTDASVADVWLSKYGLLSQEINQKLHSYRKADLYDKLTNNVKVFYSVSREIRQEITKHNDQVAKNEIQRGYELVGNVEGRKLDEQQMMSVVRRTHNHLIIAGAGTGKTTTIVGKVKYLLKSGQYMPSDILVLSFTNASATEMSERINAESGYPIEASTFHKLGLNIIKEVEGKVPKISSLQMRKFVKENVEKLMKNPDYQKGMCRYLFYNRIVPKSEFDFTNQAELDDYLRLNPPTTYNDEVVKSYGEMDIANFLFQNQIRYEYEASYVVDTNDMNFGQYKPDFYLPDYGIYIEYFGINRNGEVPAYFKGKDGKSPSEIYREGIEWKRKTHKENNTTLIECYAYEKFEGTLLDNLSEKLKQNGIQLNPISDDELWNKLTSNNDSILDGIIELFETVINLTKSNNYSIEALEKIAKEKPNAGANLQLIALIKPIFATYERYLQENNEIDFSDMINIATEYVRSGKYINPYKFVIVDEYQDISKARFNLLAELRKSNDYSLFCVGDDWQSIYRFAGSDINYITQFEKYWGPTEVSRIETTYRFTKSLIEISGEFIMQNPLQIKKAIKGMSNDNRFSLGVISGYTDAYAVQFTAETMNDLPQNSTVFLIGRYSFDVKMLEGSYFSFKYDNQNGNIIVSYSKRPDLKIQFMTAHRSKGLQADYVFIINNKKNKMGFPSKIQDAPILDLLLEDEERFPYAEERRLFYVALTRAKVKTFLVTVKGQEAVFAEELMARYDEEVKRERYTCPKCGGRLIKRSGEYGEFLGCSNYKSFGCKYTKNISSSVAKG